MGWLDRLRPARGVQTWPAIYRGGLPEVMGTGDGTLALVGEELVFRFLYHSQEFRLPLAGATIRAFRYPHGHQSSTFIPTPTHPSEPMLLVTYGADRFREARFQSAEAERIVAAAERRGKRLG